MKLKTAILLIVNLPFLLYAGNIEGKLIDSKTKSAVSYANVAIYKTDAKLPFKGLSADENGAFNLKDVPKGNYILKITYVGYLPLELPILLDDKRPSLFLASILMSENTRSLKEVKVIGQKSQMKFELDRKVFNVDQNIAAAGTSATEILKNIPSVEVDVQGNISLRNNPNVIVWINGRPSGLNEENRAQVLEQMPSESIEKIEIITNPSSKYSPEGSAGIINIVLKQDRKPGYYGSVTGGLDTFKGRNASANINYNSKKWDLNANIGYRGNEMKSTSHTDRNTWQGSDNLFLNSDNNTINKMSGVFTRINATYHLTQKDHFGVNANFDRFGRTKDGVTSYYNLFNGVNAGQFIRNADNSGELLKGNLSFTYNHQFDNKGHEIKASIDFNRMVTFNENNSDQFKNSDKQYTQRLTLGGYRNEVETQIDYSYPFSKDSKLEAGFKGEYNTRRSSTDAQKGLYDYLLIPDVSLNNEFGSSDDRNSLYITYAGRKEKLTYQIGLRGEYNILTNYSNNFDVNGKMTETPFDNSYAGIFPSFFLSYSLPNENEIQLNYTRRVNRPSGRLMNPYRDVSDSTNIKYGNPNLKPEYSNSLELNHIKTWEKHTLSSSIYYRTTSNVVQQVNYIENNVKYSTSFNITNIKAAGFEFILKDKLFKMVDLTNTLNLFFSAVDAFSYKSNIYPTNESFAWNYKSILNMGLPMGWMMQLAGGYQSRKLIAQGEVLPNWGVDAGVRKSLFNRKVSMNVMIRDLFNSRINRVNTNGANFIDYTSSWMGGRMFGFTATYNFGNSKLQKKNKENREIKEQDQMNGVNEL